MCVLAIGWRVHKSYPLLFLGNRDELYDRPTEPANWWPEYPHMLAGRDLSAMGTWSGITTTGRFAVVTNIPGHQPNQKDSSISRGHLVRDFLRGNRPAPDEVFAIRPRVDWYAGFNLLLCDGLNLVWCSSRGDFSSLPPGIYGLANDTLDESTFKVKRLKSRLAAFAEKSEPWQETRWFRALCDATRVNAEPAQSYATSSVFVRGRQYGTRASTLLSVDSENRVNFVEKRYGKEGHPLGISRFKFEVAR